MTNSFACERCHTGTVAPGAATTQIKCDTCGRAWIVVCSPASRPDPARRPSSLPDGSSLNSPGLRARGLLGGR